MIKYGDLVALVNARIEREIAWEREQLKEMLLCSDPDEREEHFDQAHLHGAAANALLLLLFDIEERYFGKC